MTHDVLIYVKQTKRIYGGKIYLKPQDGRKLMDAMGDTLTRWQRFKCWLGLDAFPDGRVDARVWIPPRSGKIDMEHWTLHDEIDAIERRSEEERERTNR